MANRSYGIPAGHRPGLSASSSNDAPLPSQRIQPPSPTRRGLHSNTLDPSQTNYPPIPPPHRHHTMVNYPGAPSDRPHAFANDMGNPYQSRDRALQDIDNIFGGPRITSPDAETRRQQPYPGSNLPYQPMSHSPERRGNESPDRRIGQHSQSSLTPLMANAAYARHESPSPPSRALGRSMERSTPRTISRSPPKFPPQGMNNNDSPYHPSAYAYDDIRMPRTPSHFHGDGYDDTFINPSEIADDGDDGFEQTPHRSNWRHSRLPNAALLGGGAFAAGGSTSPPGLATQGSDDRDMSKFYNHSANRNVAGSETGRGDPEKSAWLEEQSSGSKRLRWIAGVVIGILVLAAIAGGIVGGVLASKKSGSGSNPGASRSSGKLDINSPEVQRVLNNKNLHRVFPGIDYTPLNAQYPACLSNAPDQNNVTLDVAQLAQLAPSIRLYGTDCEQTEMVLTAIDRLGYNDTMKVWIGVWLDKNTTTTDRQLDIMYKLLDKYPAKHFAGIIVGNEVLFRQDLTEVQLASQLQQVRNNLTAKGIQLPVATSDLGDDWTAELARDSDIVMANIHPFFAGTPAQQSAGWAWSFWQNHDIPLAAATTTAAWPKHIISEIGWPSEGGNDCGANAVCSDSNAGAVASVDNMNTFMGEWVCQSMKNSTTYFWFEAFDEEWKKIFDTPTDKWESKWGLFDSDRNLKPGIKIPDCGSTIDKPY